jgi:hypothetical protein
MSEEQPVEEVVVAGFAATPEGTKDLLLSCPFDAEGAVLRVPLVEEDVNVHNPEEDDALAGAGGWRRWLAWRENVAPPLLTTLQFFFCQHRKMEQALYRMIFFIINNILNLPPQSPIKPNHLILQILNYPTS